MTPYKTMLAEGVSENVAKRVIARIEADKEPNSWKPERDTSERDRRADRAHAEAFAERLRVREEAYRLLDLIAAEFRSDPQSVQCFDKRIVDRTIYIAALTKAGHG